MDIHCSILKPPELIHIHIGLHSCNQNYALNFLCFIRAHGSMACIGITSNSKVACSSPAVVNRWLCGVHRQRT